MSLGGPPIIPIVPPNETYNRPGEYRYPRESLGGETAIDENESNGYKPTPVDTHYAAQLRPSRLSGKALNLMVTVVAGTGVSNDHPD